MNDTWCRNVFRFFLLTPLVTSAGCNVGQPGQAHPLDVTNYGIAACSSPPSGQNLPDRVVAVVRAYLPATGATFDPSQMQRNVTYRLHGLNVDENLYDSPHPNDFSVPDIGTPNSPNPYHMNLSKLPNLNPGISPAYIEVRFILTDDASGRYKFDTSLTDGNIAILGLAAGEKPSRVGLCSASVTLAKQDAAHPAYPLHDVAVVYLPIQNGAPVEGGYSIILQPQNSLDTPILIDPKVINNG